MVDIDDRHRRSTVDFEDRRSTSSSTSPIDGRYRHRFSTSAAIFKSPAILNFVHSGAPSAIAQYLPLAHGSVAGWEIEEEQAQGVQLNDSSLLICLPKGFVSENSLNGNFAWCLDHEITPGAFGDG